MVAAPGRLVERGAGDLERLAVAAGEVQRVGEVDLRALELTRAALVARAISIARRSAAVPSSTAPCAASEMPMPLSAPESAAWLPVASASSMASRAATTASR